MFVEQNQIWLESHDRCELCENFQNCFIFKSLDDGLIELLDGLNTSECSFFIMCDRGFNAEYLTKILNKKIKPRRSTLLQRFILWLRKKLNR